MSKGLDVRMTLSKREAESTLAYLDHDGLRWGHGVQKSQAIQIVEMKLRQAIINAQLSREVSP